MSERAVSYHVVVALLIFTLLLQNGSAKTGSVAGSSLDAAKTKKKQECPVKNVDKCKMCDEKTGAACLCGRLAMVWIPIMRSPSFF